MALADITFIQSDMFKYNTAFLKNTIELTDTAVIWNVCQFWTHYSTHYLWPEWLQQANIRPAGPTEDNRLHYQRMYCSYDNYQTLVSLYEIVVSVEMLASFGEFVKHFSDVVFLLHPYTMMCNNSLRGHLHFIGAVRNSQKLFFFDAIENITFNGSSTPRPRFRLLEKSWDCLDAQACIWAGVCTPMPEFYDVLPNILPRSVSVVSCPVVDISSDEAESVENTLINIEKRRRNYEEEKITMDYLQYE